MRKLINIKSNENTVQVEKQSMLIFTNKTASKSYGRELLRLHKDIR